METHRLSRFLARASTVVSVWLVASAIVACSETTESVDPAATDAAADASADGALDSNADSCGAISCVLEGAECGSIPDGCGETLFCGVCPDGETCGTDEPNKCGIGTCNPSTCSQLSASCGEISDGCAGVLDCGTCAPPDTCGGGGVPNRCGCACDRPHASTYCAGGQCFIDTCDTNWEDCDGNDLNGCEVNTTSNPAHCGGCGNTCTAAHAAPSCVGSSCGLGACDLDFDNCDSDPTTGCETNIRSDPENCGSCGNVCPSPGGSAVCIDRVCGISNCAAGRGDCDGDETNGCEINTDTSLMHCGFCNNACAFPNAEVTCSGGACVISACNPGWADCDGNAGNGCEANTNVSIQHCGACSSPCSLAHANETCSNGNCIITSCESGWGNCDGSVASGCETQTDTSVAHCGSCSNACSLAHATPVCSGGTCAVGSCSSGWNDCDGAAANGCEANINDDNHCGSCLKVILTDRQVPMTTDYEEFYEAPPGNVITGIGVRIGDGKIKMLRVVTRELLPGGGFGPPVEHRQGDSATADPEANVDLPPCYVAVGVGGRTGSNELRTLVVWGAQVMANGTLGSPSEFRDGANLTGDPEQQYVAPAGRVLTGVGMRTNSDNMQGLQIVTHAWVVQ